MTTGTSTRRIEVRARDGVPLAVWVEGDGPAIVLVHGSIADHTTFDPFVAVLRERMTTYALDRRGFGATPDSPGYTIEREFDDVAAVVDAVAGGTGGPVALWGHSYGANCAMGGAARTGEVGHLVLYEPSLGLRYPPGSIDAIEADLAAGDAEAAIVRTLVDALELTDDEVDALKASPLWATRLAAAGTVPRECRVEEGWEYRSGQFAGVTAPTLLLAGTESPPALADATRRAATAIPGARVVELAGHAHFAHKSDPTMVAALIGDFLAGSGQSSQSTGSSGA